MQFFTISNGVTSLYLHYISPLCDYCLQDFSPTFLSDFSQIWQHFPSKLKTWGKWNLWSLSWPGVSSILYFHSFIKKKILYNLLQNRYKFVSVISVWGLCPLLAFQYDHLCFGAKKETVFPWGIWIILSFIHVQTSFLIKFSHLNLFCFIVMEFVYLLLLGYHFLQIPRESHCEENVM